MTIVTLSVKLISQVSFQLHHVATRKATFARVVLRDPRVTHDPPAFPKGNRISYFASISKFSSIYFSLCFSKVYYHRCTLFILHLFSLSKLPPAFKGYTNGCKHRVIPCLNGVRMLVPLSCIIASSFEHSRAVL